MHQKDVLGRAEAEKAVNAILKEASKQPERPISVAVVDDKGDLLYFVRMDKAALLTSYVPILKAYTAARMGMDTASFHEMLKNREWDIAWLGDSKFTPIPGGVPIAKADGTVLGAIGVGGRAAEEDQELAKVGVKAISL